MGTLMLRKEIRRLKMMKIKLNRIAREQRDLDKLKDEVMRLKKETSKNIIAKTRRFLAKPSTKASVKSAKTRTKKFLSALRKVAQKVADSN